MPNDKSRLHIQKELPDLGIKINVFSDEPQEAFNLMLSMMCLVGEADLPRKPSEAHLARLNNEALAKVKTASDTVPQPAARSNGSKQSKPVCRDCGYDGAVKLVSFTASWA